MMAERVSTASSGKGRAVAAWCPAMTLQDRRGSAPDVAELERVAWTRAVLSALRRRVDGARALAAWRARVDRPFALEALLGVFDATEPPLSTREVARALGLAPERVRSVLRHAERTGALQPSPHGWSLTARGRGLRGALESAQAAALRDVAPGSEAVVWAELWRQIESPNALDPVDPRPGVEPAVGWRVQRDGSSE